VYPDERDSLAAMKALVRLAESLPLLRIKVVTTGETSSITPFLDATLLGDRYKFVETLPLLDRVCQPKFFESDLTEEIGKAFHRRYLEGEEERDKQRGSQSASTTHVPWEELDPEERESNFAQASGYEAMVQKMGYSIEITDDWDPELPDFSVDQIQAMAKQEHERWVRYKKDRGWTLGPRKPGQKTRPDLVSWKELDDLIVDGEELGKEHKARTIDEVTGAPELLLRFGMIVKGPGQGVGERGE
jgi:hypothetical protein